MPNYDYNKEHPRRLDHYTLCTADCVDGYHIPEYRTCERCGSFIHVDIFEVNHPEYGRITVGAECFKDVMGYHFTKAHQKAILTYDSLQQWAKAFQEFSETFRRPPGLVIALGLPREVSGAKMVGATLFFRTNSGVKSNSAYNYMNDLYGSKVPRLPQVPYGWSKTIINAGLDLGVWSYSDSSDIQNGYYVVAI